MQMIGHQKELLQLRRAQDEGKLAHAYLFSGQNGIGKKMAAYEFALELFCKRPPCRTCPQCKKIEHAVHPDLIVISAEKKDITIEQMRGMQARIQMHAVEGKYKIVIIDDAEKMNASAANSVLKTLEEPPQDTHLFLITSRMHMLLPTIISRCQKITFSPPSERDVTSILEKRLEISPANAKVLSVISNGSIGYALSFPIDSLEDVFSSVKKIWNKAPISQILELSERWSATNPEAVLTVLLNIYRDILAYQALKREPAFEAIATQIIAVAQQRPMYVIEKKIANIQSAMNDIEAAYNKQMLFEDLLLILAS